MIAYCEDGISVEEMHLAQQIAQLNRCERKLAEGDSLVSIVSRVMVDGHHPYDARWATKCTELILNPDNGYVQAYAYLQTH